MSGVHIQKGHLLISDPSLVGDVSFSRSVVLITDYNTEGAVGFILNKPTDYTLAELVPDINSDFKVYNGGPVEQDNLYFLHTVPELIPNSIKISDGVHWGGDFETLTSLLNLNQISEQDVRFFLGYSGWSQNQLENEVTSNSWILTNNPHKENILNVSSEDFWKSRILEQDDKFKIWANLPENPLYN